MEKIQSNFSLLNPSVNFLNVIPIEISSQLFQKESSLIKKTIPNEIESIEHIGSTYFKDIPGSNIIDILITVKNYPLSNEIHEILLKIDFNFISKNNFEKEETLYFKELAIAKDNEVRGIKLFFISNNNQKAIQSFIDWRNFIDADKEARNNFITGKLNLIKYFY